MEQISVITPCFNAEPYLRACLESVTAQGDLIHRHIVMDAGSTDGSVNTLKEYAATNPHLTWRTERDEGQSDALNKALLLVETPYFAWLNADDLLISNKLRSLCQVTHIAPSPAIVYGDYKVIDAQGQVIRRRRQPSFNYWDCLYSYLTVQNCSAIFRTDLCRDTGGFDRELNFCMDYDLVLRLARAGAVRHVREFVGCFRLHDQAKTARLQDVCRFETLELRQKISAHSPRSLQLLHWISKARVAGRMLKEGCIASRLKLKVRDAAISVR